MKPMRKPPDRAPKPPQRRVPLGKALQWTPEDLDRMSEVTPTDTEAAAVWARQEPVCGALADAKEAEEDV